MQAVKDYQTRIGLDPADGYGGLKVLTRLRAGKLTLSHRHSGAMLKASNYDVLLHI